MAWVWPWQSERLDRNCCWNRGSCGQLEQLCHTVTNEALVCTLCVQIILITQLRSAFRFPHCYLLPCFSPMSCFPLRMWGAAPLTPFNRLGSEMKPLARAKQVHVALGEWELGSCPQPSGWGGVRSILPTHPVPRGSLEVLSCELCLVLLAASAGLCFPECWREKGFLPLALDGQEGSVPPVGQPGILLGVPLAFLKFLP